MGVRAAGTDASAADTGIRVVAMFNFEAKESQPFPPDPHGV